MIWFDRFVRFRSFGRARAVGIEPLFFGTVVKQQPRFTQNSVNIAQHMPEDVGVTPGAETAGVDVELVGADVVLDDVAGRAFLHLHALVPVRRD